MRWIAVGIALLLLGLGGTWGLARNALRAPGGPEAEPVLFEVEPGSGLKRVARELEARGLVRSARATEWWARLHGQASAIRAGEYELSPSWTAERVLETLVSGRVKTWPVVLPEGIRATEIATRLAEAGLVDEDAFVAASEDAALARELGIPADRLEGYLYPETYQLPRGRPAPELARTMVRQFYDVWRDVEPKAAESGLSMHEIVTLASIVEKETGVPAERPVIAAVFLNRLKKGMRLETDPAVIYGIEEFDGNLRRVHLRDDGNPYNTYRHFGLPPGPIASPGRDALLAVVEPADSDYLYFVSRNDGTHVFSRSYREHVNAVNRYQKRRR